MAKVTKDVMAAFIEEGVFPPRHQRGCPKNFLRTLPLVCASKGMSPEETKKVIRAHDRQESCTCRE